MENINCNYCQEEEFVTFRQNKGYAGLLPTDKILTTSSIQIYHDICKNCGTIVRSYIKELNKLQ
ncbi:hypothetical protein NC01_00460 [Streptococcus uberis]|nr:hypothetical protein NC01_00460 [Streptococcus uberis]